MQAPEDFRDALRDRVLEALDDFAREQRIVIGKEQMPALELGATDADLPALFKALDQQANILWKRQIDKVSARYREESLAILDGRASIVPVNGVIR